MPRQSISFSKPNDDWLKAQVNSEEYSRKSELLNDLIRQARSQQSEINWIKAKLDRAEKSGFTNDSREDILNQSKSLLNGWIQNRQDWHGSYLKFKYLQNSQPKHILLGNMY